MKINRTCNVLIINKLTYYCLFALLLLGACKNAKNEFAKMQLYKGPMIKAFNVEMNYSDSAKLIVNMTSPLQLEYENGNQDFPKGIKVIFYNKAGQQQTQLTSNKAKHFKQENKWTATGNVIVKNLLKNEVLNTEELNWTPGNQTIYTNKYVIITTDDEILKGNGLTARQDFTAYTITNPTGKFKIKK